MNMDSGNSSSPCIGRTPGAIAPFGGYVAAAQCPLTSKWLVAFNQESSPL